MPRGQTPPRTISLALDRSTLPQGEGGNQAKMFLRFLVELVRGQIVHGFFSAGFDYVALALG
jgi:hypothetical protein